VTRSLVALLAVLLLSSTCELVCGTGSAQDLAGSQNDRYFRVEAERGTTRRGKPILYGWVYNDYGLPATDVRLLAEAVEAGGQVADRKAGYVNGEIPAFSRAYFEMAAPSGGASERVTVSSFFFRKGGASR
jgi:hypothetical protein